MSARPEKAFVGGFLGVNSLFFDGSNKADEGGYIGFFVGLCTGYRIIFKNIFLEPSISYILAKTNEVSYIAPLGWQGGFRLGFKL
jgi:hypothetical protein